jgi:hypothetical protein
MTVEEYLHAEGALLERKLRVRGGRARLHTCVKSVV